MVWYYGSEAYGHHQFGQICSWQPLNCMLINKPPLLETRNMHGMHVYIRIQNWRNCDYLGNVRIRCENTDHPPSSIQFEHSLWSSYFLFFLPVFLSLLVSQCYHFSLVLGFQIVFEDCDFIQTLCLCFRNPALWSLSLARRHCALAGKADEHLVTHWTAELDTKIMELRLTTNLPFFSFHMILLCLFVHLLLQHVFQLTCTKFDMQCTSLTCMTKLPPPTEKIIL